MIKPFKPDGVIPFPGVLACVAASLAGGIASGYLLGFIAYKGFSLLIIFPLLMGLGAGGATLMGIRLGQVRNVAFAWLLAGLSGAISVAASHHIGYLLVRHDVIENAQQDQGDEGEVLTADEANALFDQHLENQTGSPGFLGFVKLEAREGTSIERHGQTTSVGEDGTWILWMVEMLMALMISVAVARKEAAQPFCSRCNAWYKTASAAFLDGSAIEEIRRMFEGASLTRLKETRVTLSAAHQPHALLTLKECKACTLAEPVMTLEKVSYDGKNRESKKDAGAWTVARSVAHDAMQSVRDA